MADPPASSTAPAEAGGAADFDWHNQWYPVAFLDDLDDSAPLTFTLLGEPLVFWRDPTASELTFRCTADKCPHRLVPLSEGRVNEKGEIECGYHGWTFDGVSGKCTSIPQLPSGGTAMDTALASPRSCVTPYPTQVAQGMLWVLPVSGSTEADQPALPLIPELDDPDCVCQDIFRDLPMDYATLLENVMDVSHVPFTHHNSVGKRERDARGARDAGRAATRRVHRDLGGGPALGQVRLAVHRVRRAVADAPHPAHGPVHDAHRGVRGAHDPGRCRLMARFPFIFKAALPRAFFKIVPRWWSHLSQNAILEDDQIFLHKQERTIEIERDVKKRSYAQACYMPTKADTYVAAFRRWIVDMAGGSPAWPEGTADALPPRAPTKEELLDRYFAHTVNCKSCSVALANLTKARKALRVVSLVALASAAAAFARAAPTKLVVALAVLAAATAATREFMGGLVQKMKVGPYPPPRRPPSMMEAALESARLAGA